MFENLMSQIMAWLLTYSLHSTLFLCLALLASKRLAGRWARLEEAMWRFALVAALVTATVQLAAGWEPVAGRWTLNAPVASSLEAASRFDLVPARALRVVPAVPAGSQTPALPSWPFDLRSTVLGLWALGALLLCLRWTGSYLRLKRRLRARPEVVGGGMFTLMRQLSGDLGLAPLVRLTCSSRVSVPVALGLGRPEICVPPRAISHLEPEQQEGMLAHELAHLVRRDPFWLAFSRMLAGALFFQPLNWVACRRLRELSERLCDEWAVERTGRPLSLARCLAEVAGWSVRSVSSLPVPSMADRPSSLAKRIRHLLDDSRSPERRVRPVWIGAGMLVLLAAVAAVAPGVYAAVSIEEPREAAPAAEAAEAVEPVEPIEPEDPIEPHYDIIEDEIEARIEGELAGMEAELEGLDASLEAALAPLEELEGLGFVGDLDFDFDFDGMTFLSEEEAEEIAQMAEEISEKYAGEYAALAESMMADMGPELERISEEVNRKLAPEIERISEEVNRELMPEIERISERVANEMEPELERLRAEADRLRREGGLSKEERERIRSQARELSRRSRPTEEEMKAIRESQRKYRDEMRKFMEDHREEMEAMRSEARAHSEAMRDQMRQRMEADPKFRDLRERHRRDMEQIRERHREEMREHREKIKQDREKAREKAKEKEKEKEEKQV